MRRASLSAALLLASAGAVLLAAEMAVRVLRPGLAVPPVTWANPFWVHESELGWFHRPGETGRFTGKEFTHHVAINSMGFRDLERSLQRAAEGSRRIAVLGDSFTWGHGVEGERIFTRVMEGTLERSEVWNLGVSGYSTDQELLLLRRMAPRIRPDLVLVMICRNDPAANTTRRAGLYFKPRFVAAEEGLALTGVPVPRPSQAARALARMRGRSALLNGLSLLAERAGLMTPGPGGWEEQERILRLLLDGILDEARGAGASLVLAIVPSASHVHHPDPAGSEARTHRALERWSRDRGAALVDLTDGLRERCSPEGEGACYYARDRHWNPRGHQEAARILAGTLPESPPAGSHSM